MLIKITRFINADAPPVYKKSMKQWHAISDKTAVLLRYGDMIKYELKEDDLHCSPSYINILDKYSNLLIFSNFQMEDQSYTVTYIFDGNDFIKVQNMAESIYNISQSLWYYKDEKCPYEDGDLFMKYDFRGKTHSNDRVISNDFSAFSIENQNIDVIVLVSNDKYDMVNKYIHISDPFILRVIETCTMSKYMGISLEIMNFEIPDDNTKFIDTIMI